MFAGISVLFSKNHERDVTEQSESKYVTEVLMLGQDVRAGRRAPQALHLLYQHQGYS